MPKNILKNISEVFNSCDIEINKFISCPYALGISCFSQNQIDYSIEALADAWENKESIEGINAFFNNRKPNWITEE